MKTKNTKELIKSFNLIIYKNLLQDKVIKKMLKASCTHFEGKATQCDKYLYQVCNELINSAEKYGYSGDIWHSYLLDLVLKDENIFSLSCEANNFSAKSTISKLALLDIYKLIELYNFNFDEIFAKSEGFAQIFRNYTPISQLKNEKLNTLIDSIDSMLSSDSYYETILKELVTYYRTEGCGILSKHTSFYWEINEGLTPVENMDPIKMEDIIGYELQKEVSITNTESFINGSIANNVLIFGDRGTGKSSSIKALCNKYSNTFLKVVEISKYEIKFLPKLLKLIGNRSYRFIIFIDDLSFENFETDYKYLKSSMEGSLESKNNNILIYATSNRRHLIKEMTLNTDSNSNEELHPSEGIQEKLSLSDRFGISITYSAPNKKEYLQIVKGIANYNNINLPEEELFDKALKWELWHNGPSGRTAKQFINSLL